VRLLSEGLCRLRLSVSLLLNVADEAKVADEAAGKETWPSRHRGARRQGCL